MTFPLPDQSATCLVTGASSGIGREIARELARRGYNLTLAARRKQLIDQLAIELIAEFGVEVETNACDVSDAADRARLLESIAGTGKRIDILVNNAAVGADGKFFDGPLDRQLAQINTNVLAVVALTHPIVRLMVDQGSGAILNVASTAAFQPMPRQNIYGASKVFVLHFGEALHTELKGTGVTCTTLCPGPTRTEFMSANGMGDYESSTPSWVWMTARDTAVAGVNAMVHGDRTCVPKFVNKIGAVAGQKAPRSLVLATFDRFWPVGR